MPCRKAKERETWQKTAVKRGHPEKEQRRQEGLLEIQDHPEIQDRQTDQDPVRSDPVLREEHPVARPVDQVQKEARAAARPARKAEHPEQQEALPHPEEEATQPLQVAIPDTIREESKRKRKAFCRFWQL